MVYVPTNEGFLKGIDRATGSLIWEKKLQGPLWSSPLVVDDVLIQPDCLGTIHAYDVSDPVVDPPELWTVQTDWCTESTAALWDGLMVVGDRKGHVWAYRDPA
jgi:outer membrane protein assembly factor BamB